MIKVRVFYKSGRCQDYLVPDMPMDHFTGNVAKRPGDRISGVEFI